mmetsp:Transcript_29026/g.52121  ORF Transcript_29026/g.52121 Transcript_29026/m.52121 type:complete len:80 (+) Transcript_29026:2840-3079(+)
MKASLYDKIFNVFLHPWNVMDYLAPPTPHPRCCCSQPLTTPPSNPILGFLENQPQSAVRPPKLDLKAPPKLTWMHDPDF